MNILAIETSCDDTCASVIKASDKKKFNFDILSNIVSSQIKVHRKYGGVYPTLAKREHQRNLVPVLTQALKQAKLLKISKSTGRPQADSPEDCFLISKQIPNSKLQILNSILEREPELLKKLSIFLQKYQKPEIDLIAVTIGPGLEPCLWTGINFVKALSCHWDLPIVPINHIEAHIFANLLPQISLKSKIKKEPWARLRQQKSKIKNQKIDFPAVCLVVSGGHTQLILMKNIGKYKILGETRDDAAGECFDKTARILGLGYPGGPAIASEATKLAENSSLPTGGELFSVKLPRPMLNTKDYDFSFSGLKTAVLYNFKKQPVKVRKSKKYIQEMCYEIQQAIIDVLIKKTIKAAKSYKAKTIILGGGVTANRELRKQFKSNVKHQMSSVKSMRLW